MISGRRWTRLAVGLVLATSSFWLVNCGSATDAKNGSGATGPSMRPGENCEGCHSFSVAGTVFSGDHASSEQGIGAVTINITDKNGKSLSLTSNSAGNFYTNSSMTPPLTVELVSGSTTRKMTGTATTGACAACHTSAGANGAPGRVAVMN